MINRSVVCLVVCLAIGEFFIAETTAFQGGDKGITIFYGFEANSDELRTIDPATGSVKSIGPAGFNFIAAMTFDSLRQKMFAFSPSPTGTIIELDLTTGIGSVLHPSTSLNGLAFDASTDTLYGITSSSPQRLVTIDSETGVFTNAGEIAPGGVLIRLAFDPVTQKLFSFDDLNRTIVSLDPTTVQLTTIGKPGGRVIGLDYDPVSGQILGLEALTETLVTIDRETATATALHQGRQLNGFLALASGLAVVPLLGDVNRDGSVDLLDVAPFVERLILGKFQIEADVNQDGVVDLLDVAPFVDLLTRG